MKLLIIALAVLGLANGKSIITQDLKQDFQDFKEMLPMDKITAIVIDYVQNDKEMQNVIDYMQSEDFKSIVLGIEGLPEYWECVNYLTAQGLEVKEYIEWFHDVVGLPPIPIKSYRRGQGLRGLIDDIIAILPMDELKALFNEKLQTSEDFKNLYEAIRGPKFQSIVEKLKSMPKYQELKQKLRDNGIDVDKFVELLKALFGLTRGYY